MKVCLVTGVTGLIGSALIESLCNRYYVYGVSKSKATFSHEKYSHIEMDLSNQSDYSFLPENIDFIFHLAQSNNFRDFPNSVKDIFNVNTLSTLLLLDYARKISVKNFILASSGGVYGYSDQPFVEEYSPIQENKELGFYLGTKMCAEILAESYTNFFNMIILRPFFVYGSKQSKNMLIPRLIDNVNNNNKIILHGENGISINPIHVNDAVKCIEKTLDLNKSIKINIAGSEIIHLREIGNLIGAVLNKKPKFEVDYNSKPKNIIADINLMKELLFKPEISIRNGILETCRNILL